MKIKPFGTSTAKIVYRDEKFSNVMELPKEEILNLFKACGVILFREFNVNYEQMKKFSQQFSSRFVIDPTKENQGTYDDWLIQLADGGTHYIAPHCENGSTPFTSDVIWFCCDVPAAEDGETLFWNGVSVWDELSEEVKQLFLNKKIKFWRDVTAEEWKSFLGADSTIDRVKQLMDNLEGISYRINQDDSIYMEYFCSAVKKPNFDDKLAFANSIMYEYDRQRVALEDGTPIPEKAIAEINALMDKFTETIPWQSGDMAMIDNSKFLHGRKAFNDTKRKIYTTQTSF